MDDATARAKFGSIYDQHRRAVLVYCMRRARQEDALDALNETFAIVWRRIDQAPAPEDALPWLYSNARGVLSNQRRSNRRFARLIHKSGSVAAATEPGPETQVVLRQEADHLLGALNRLRPIDREILQLHTWEELPHATIAASLGISENAVAKRVSRALKRLTVEVKRGAGLNRSPSAVPERGTG